MESNDRDAMHDTDENESNAEDDPSISPEVMAPLILLQVYVWLYPESVLRWARSLTHVIATAMKNQWRVTRLLLVSRAMRQFVFVFVFGLFVFLNRWAEKRAKRFRLSLRDRNEINAMRREAYENFLRWRCHQRDQHACGACSPQTTPEKPLRILCLDGGGIRGVITCAVLSRILEKYPDFLDQVDVVAGTSTGGFITLCIALGFSPQHVIRLYHLIGPPIFSNSRRRVLVGLDGLLRSRYGDKGRKDSLKAVFGDTRMDSLMKHVVIPTLQVCDLPDDSFFVPHVFTNFASCTNTTKTTAITLEPRTETSALLSPTARYLESVNCKSLAELRLVDLLLQTAAAPTFFPAHKGHIDGGLFANNPSLLAITSVCNSGANIENVVVLSLGTGQRRARNSILDRVMDWGLVQWATKLVPVFMQSSETSTDMACRLLLRERYHRFDTLVPEELAMDSVEQRWNMIDAAKAVDIQSTLEFVENVFLAHARC